MKISMSQEMMDGSGEPTHHSVSKALVVNDMSLEETDEQYIPMDPADKGGTQGPGDELAFAVDAGAADGKDGVPIGIPVNTTPRTSTRPAEFGKKSPSIPASPAIVVRKGMCMVEQPSLDVANGGPSAGRRKTVRTYSPVVGSEEGYLKARLKKVAFGHSPNMTYAAMAAAPLAKADCLRLLAIPTPSAAEAAFVEYLKSFCKWIVDEKLFTSGCFKGITFKEAVEDYKPRVLRMMSSPPSLVYKKEDKDFLQYVRTFCIDLCDLSSASLKQKGSTDDHARQLSPGKRGATAAPELRASSPKSVKTIGTNVTKSCMLQVNSPEQVDNDSIESYGESTVHQDVSSNYVPLKFKTVDAGKDDRGKECSLEFNAKLGQSDLVTKDLKSIRLTAGGAMFQKGPAKQEVVHNAATGAAYDISRVAAFGIGTTKEMVINLPGEGTEGVGTTAASARIGATTVSPSKFICENNEATSTVGPCNAGWMRVPEEADGSVKTTFGMAPVNPSQDATGSQEGDASADIPRLSAKITATLTEDGIILSPGSLLAVTMVARAVDPKDAKASERKTYPVPSVKLQPKNTAVFQVNGPMSTRCGEWNKLEQISWFCVDFRLRQVVDRASVLGVTRGMEYLPPGLRDTDLPVIVSPGYRKTRETSVPASIPLCVARSESSDSLLVVGCTDPFQRALDLVEDVGLRERVLLAPNPAAALALAGKFLGPVHTDDVKTRDSLALFNDWFNAGIIIRFSKGKGTDLHVKQSAKLDTPEPVHACPGRALHGKESILPKASFHDTKDAASGRIASTVSLVDLEAVFDLAEREGHNPHIVRNLLALKSAVDQHGVKPDCAIVPLLVQLRAVAMRHGYCPLEGGKDDIFTISRFRQSWYNLLISLVKDEKVEFGRELHELMYYCVFGLSD